jgi:hypothetical protein
MSLLAIGLAAFMYGMIAGQGQEIKVLQEELKAKEAIVQPVDTGKKVAAQ